MAQLPEFDALRRRLGSEYSVKRQEAGDAVQRRFAANGMMNSGAMEKTIAKSEAALGKEEADARGMIDFQEIGEGQRRKEVGEQRAFQTSERLGAQGFQTGERLGGQQFSQGMFDKDFGLKERTFGAQEDQRGKDNVFRDREFAENQKTNWLTAFLGLKDANLNDEQQRYIAGKLYQLGYHGLPGQDIK